jgi:hypothetical protein
VRLDGASGRASAERSSRPRSGRAAERSGSAEQRGATRRERTLAVMGHWPWARAREASAMSPSAASAQEESFIAAGGATGARAREGEILDLGSTRRGWEHRGGDTFGVSHDLRVPRNMTLFLGT